MGYEMLEKGGYLGKDDIWEDCIMGRIKIRAGLCGLMIGVALVLIVSVVFTLAEAEPVLGGNAALAAVETPTGAYLVTDHQGYVGVYDLREAPSRLLTVTDIRLATLRQRDRAALESGIAVATREELLMLLEDFGS